MNEEIRIELKDVTTGYTTRHQFREVTGRLNASLNGGEFVCLLGPNGAGKSTLLRTLAGFQHPLSGDILIGGRKLSEYSSRELARLMSVVLTDRPLLENMDVEALVALGRTPYTGFWGRMTAADRRAVEEAVSLTGIEPLRHRQVSTLSDGERQKVMIAKAFAQTTPIIFLDEPTAFLDYPSKVEIMLLLHSLAHDYRKIIFMSTHDLDMALQIADKIWLMDKMLGVTTGTHRGLTESGALENYFARPGIRFDREEGLFKIDKSKLTNPEKK